MTRFNICEKTEDVELQAISAAAWHTIGALAGKRIVDCYRRYSRSETEGTMGYSLIRLELMGKCKPASLTALAFLEHHFQDLIPNLRDVTFDNKSAAPVLDPLIGPWHMTAVVQGISEMWYAFSPANLVSIERESDTKYIPAIIVHQARTTNDLLDDVGLACGGNWVSEGVWDEQDASYTQLGRYKQAHRLESTVRRIVSIYAY